MLIGFIGAPASGKTTVAALLFGKLKSHEYVADLITERARRYIIGKRLKGLPGVLTDDDQEKIFLDQVYEEEVYTRVLPKSEFIVTDGCSAHFYLYLKSVTPGRTESIKNALRNYDLIFYCERSRSQYSEKDEGRIHSLEESDDIDAKIPEVLATLGVTAIKLTGVPKIRADVAFEAVMKYKMNDIT